MKPLLNYWFIATSLLLFATNFICGQGITVNQNNFANPQSMVEFLVGNSCLNITNANWSSNTSASYFNQNSSSFAFAEGVVISSGNTQNIQGTYTGQNLSSSTGQNLSDPFLQNLSNQVSGTTVPIRDVAFLEFDFVPLSNFFSFNFIFASNEYGQFQCLSNDIFSFTLTNLSNNTSVNLGIIPQTGQPVGVQTIRNTAFNLNCNSVNPALFGDFHELNPGNSYINMKGNTVTLTASSPLTPNTPYRIRLAIADYGDIEFDSAIFVESGSFITEFDLGNNLTICSGEETTLSVPFNSTFDIQWFFQGNPIVGATNNSLTVNQPGVYAVEIFKDGCFITDSITIGNLNIATPTNLFACSDNSTAFFNITQTTTDNLGLNPAIYQISYYPSLADAQALTNQITNPQLTNFESAGQSIFIRIQNMATGDYCSATPSFQLIIQTPLNSPQTLLENICSGENSTSFNLASLQTTIIDGQVGSFGFSYFNSLQNAQANQGAINPNVTFANTNIPTYWVVIFYANNPSCRQIVEVNFNLFPRPDVDQLDSPQLVCTEFVLPSLTNGNYFTGSNGSGTPLFAGDIIDENGTYFIFNSNSNSDGCTNQSSFEVIIVEKYDPSAEACGSFTLPAPPLGTYYTAPNGPNGNGVETPAGTVFTNNSSTEPLEINLYYYAEIDGVLCVDELIIIIIYPLLLVDQPDDVVACNSYTLPPIQFGNYFADASGTMPLFEGSVINQTSTLYVLRISPENCISSHAFQINIINTNLFTTITACGSFNLPPLTVGNYYSQPGGQGNLIDPSIAITQSQQVYYFANTTISPNCTENLNYNIVINPLAEVDVIESGNFCGQFILPLLNNGTYYRLPGGPNVPNQLALMPFQVIDLSGVDLLPGTYYIYAPPNQFGCPNESSFTISISPFPPTDPVIDKIECEPYTVTTTFGSIYTQPGGPNGSGVLVNSSDVFSEDNTFYMYAIDENTGCEVDKPFNIFYFGIDLPDYQDYTFCDVDNFQLPILSHVPINQGDNYFVNYYWQPNGVDPIPDNFVFNTSGEYTIYVYAENDARFGILCISEKVFTVTISQTLTLPSFAEFNANYCGSFTLPQLPVQSGVTFNYYNSSSFEEANIINPNDYTFNQDGIYTIWVYAKATNNELCNASANFTFRIFPLRETSLPDQIVCVDVTNNLIINPVLLSSGINQSQYLIEWILDGQVVGTGSNFLANQTGTYTVLATRVPQQIAPLCDYVAFQFTLEPSSIAIAEVIVSQPFENIGEATVNILGGFGNYQFTLNGQFTQSSPTFTNLSSGYYEVTITDIKNNCGSVVLPFFILNYPRYFTPNNDGYNDFWNIPNLFLVLENSELFIIDRFGKFIKQIRPTDAGWDGTLHGKQLPSNDYWFILKYKDDTGLPRILKDHFSLIR